MATPPDRDVSRNQAKHTPLTAAEAPDRAEQEHWREEVISRVRQHRARRRRSDPDASMELDFPAESAFALAAGPAQPAAPVPAPLEDLPKPVDGISVKPTERFRPPRKIIRFPPNHAVQAAASQEPVMLREELELELAAPVLEAPRILEVSEAAPEVEPAAARLPRQLELLPSFADICLDPIEESGPDLDDLPLQPATLLRRFTCGVLDCAVVLLGVSIFAFGFAALAVPLPASRLMLPCALAVSAALWLLFQYIFLVFGRATPGMLATHLELAAFDGKRASTSACRSRALAITLSVVSVTLGFVWALVDEDTLGWHDRISQTYLRSAPRSTVSTEPM